MRDKFTYIVISLLIACSLFYGRELFHGITHNRMMNKINIFVYNPINASSIVYFNNVNNLERSFVVDSSDLKIINSIKDKITYPLAIINFPTDRVIMGRVTTKQERRLKEELTNLTGSLYEPITRKENNYTFFFYYLPDNRFITATFHEGLFLLCQDYHYISKTLSHPREENELFLEQNKYLSQSLEDYSVAYLFKSRDKNFVLNYQDKENKIYFEGRYFTKLKIDTLSLNNNNIAQLLNVDSSCVDSISHEKDNRIEIWLNK